MGRKIMTEEEKTKAEEFRKTPEGLRASLSKLKEREQKLLADLAVRESPDLEIHISDLVKLLKGVSNAETVMSKVRDAETMYDNALRDLKLKLDEVRPIFADKGVEVETILPQLKRIKFRG